MKKKILITLSIILLSVILCIGFGIYRHYEHRNSIMEDIEFREVATKKIDNPKDINDDKFIYQITNKKKLQRWGIDTENIKVGEDEFLCYSLGYQIERIYHGKYNPAREWKNGPYIYDVDYKKSEDKVLHIYVVKDIGVFEFCSFKGTLSE